MSEPVAIAVAPPPGNLAATTRRAFVRYPCSPLLSRRAVASAKFRCRWADALDVSRDGLELLLGRPFDLETRLHLVLKSTFQNTLHELQVRVVTCKPRPGNNWLIGCKFLTPLSNEQFHSLG
jgi:hypothetical protein